MRHSLHRLFVHGFLVAMLFSPQTVQDCSAAGLTVITHGFELDSTFPGWVSAMADLIPNHPSFPGTNFTVYRMTVTYNNGYAVGWSRVSGGPPSATDSGEIIVELDWSHLSGDVFDSY